MAKGIAGVVGGASSMQKSWDALIPPPTPFPTLAPGGGGRCGAITAADVRGTNAAATGRGACGGGGRGLKLGVKNPDDGTPPKPAAPPVPLLTPGRGCGGCGVAIPKDGVRATPLGLNPPRGCFSPQDPWRGIGLLRAPVAAAEAGPRSLPWKKACSGKNEEW